MIREESKEDPQTFRQWLDDTSFECAKRVMIRVRKGETTPITEMMDEELLKVVNPLIH